MKQDLQIFNLIKQEEDRQTMGIELIASENYVTPQVLEALGSVCTNKYAEGYPGARYYGGCEVVDQIEQVAIDRLCEIFEAEYVPQLDEEPNKTVRIERDGDTFFVEGKWLIRVINSTNFDDYESVSFFEKNLTEAGVYTALEEAGIQDGNTVDIYGIQFDYMK